MALIARIKHPYIVEFKEAWVEKVSYNTGPMCLLGLNVLEKVSSNTPF
jgi:hypothetical protein